jgi:hypothetical protein
MSHPLWFRVPQPSGRLRHRQRLRQKSAFNISDSGLLPDDNGVYFQHSPFNHVDPSLEPSSLAPPFLPPSPSISAHPWELREENGALLPSILTTFAQPAEYNGSGHHAGSALSPTGTASAQPLNGPHYAVPIHGAATTNVPAATCAEGLTTLGQPGSHAAHSSSGFPNNVLSSCSSGFDSICQPPSHSLISSPISPTQWRRHRDHRYRLDPYASCVATGFESSSNRSDSVAETSDCGLRCSICGNYNHSFFSCPENDVIRGSPKTWSFEDAKLTKTFPTQYSYDFSPALRSQSALPPSTSCGIQDAYSNPSQDTPTIAGSPISPGVLSKRTASPPTNASLSPVG